MVMSVCRHAVSECPFDPSARARKGHTRLVMTKRDREVRKMLKAIYAEHRAQDLYVTAFRIVVILGFVALVFLGSPTHVALVKSDKLPTKDYSRLVPAPAEPIGDEVHQKTKLGVTEVKRP
jgi:hypothetical protein